MFYRGGARKRTETVTFPAPRRGLIRNDSYAVPQGEGAEVLDNFFPTAEGMRMRGGTTKHATIGGDVEHIATYEGGGGNKLFAADSTKIYDITSPADPDVAPTADVSSLTSGKWASVQFSITGGDYLVMVNGADDMELYNGTSWQAVNSGSSPISITGGTTADFSHVWAFKSRLFFIEGGTMSAWYLPVDSVGGAATEIPLGGVFNLGGSLLFGGTWSLDSGDGLDDVCLFFTDKGEVAVYTGTDPSSSTTWSLKGVYRIGRPLGKNAHFKAGGDFAVVTDDGIVPISAAIQQDRAALKANAVTYPIESLWRDTVAERSGTTLEFDAALWHSETMLVIAVPTFSALPAYVLVSNARTGAWSRYTGWDARCLAIYQDRLYFGTASDTILRGEVTGADEDVNYTATWVPRFDRLNDPGEKVAHHARLVARSSLNYSLQLFAQADYETSIPTPLAADGAESAGAWDTGLWGTMMWGTGAGAKVSVSEWQNVSATGHALAPGLQVTSGRTNKPDIEIVALDLHFERGRVMG